MMVSVLTDGSIVNVVFVKSSVEAMMTELATGNTELGVKPGFACICPGMTRSGLLTLIAGVSVTSLNPN